MQLDIMEPKVPEDIYKTHLEHSRKTNNSSKKKNFNNFFALPYPLPGFRVQHGQHSGLVSS